MIRFNYHKTSIIIALFVAIFAMGGLAQAETITIGPIRGNYDFYRIQDGIDVANDGDVVLVAPREYVITEPITFRGKAITVRSEAGPELTTIRMDPDFDFSIIIFDSGEDSNSLLEGFTITGSSDRGISCVNSSPRVENCMFISNLGSGIQCLSSSPIINNCIITGSEHDSGINCRENSSPIITNCIIYENIADGSGGGGIYCNDSSPTIANCTISENEAEDAGGGIECINSSPTLIDCSIIYNFAYHECGGMYNNDNSHPTLTNCVFVGNFAYDEGGGMLNRENSNPILNNCIFSGNSAGYGGGILNEGDSYPTLTNCTISGNSAQWYGGGISDNENSSSSVINCIIWCNPAPDEAQIYNDQYSLATVSYSNVQLFGSLIWPGEGNINKNPLFADPNKGDYHLKSSAGRWDPNSQSWVIDDVNSPCIDAGDPASDFSNEPEPDGGQINMGAYGGTNEASKSFYESVVKVEDFETGDFSSFDWIQSGDAEWEIVSDEQNQGFFCAKSGLISNNENSTLGVTLNCIDGEISFCRKVSSELGFDHLRFYIDGVQMGRWSGERDWDEISYDVSAGLRTFEWTYSKDRSRSEGDDTTWIDDIIFPID